MAQTEGHRDRSRCFRLNAARRDTLVRGARSRTQGTQDQTILRLKHMKRAKTHARFALCIRTGSSEDLEPRKLYRVLPDRAASRDGYLRVVDESGEDYLYPASYFVPVKLPASVVRDLDIVHRRPRPRLRAARG